MLLESLCTDFLQLQLYLLLGAKWKQSGDWVFSVAADKLRDSIWQSTFGIEQADAELYPKEPDTTIFSFNSLPFSFPSQPCSRHTWLPTGQLLIKALIITGCSSLIMHKPSFENLTNENRHSVSHRQTPQCVLCSSNASCRFSTNYKHF